MRVGHGMRGWGMGGWNKGGLGKGPPVVGRDGPPQQQQQDGRRRAGQAHRAGGFYIKACTTS